MSQAIQTAQHSVPIPVPKKESIVDKARALATVAEEKLWLALEEVEDPEYPISIVDMGLIYGLKLLEDTVHIDITFTSMGCPCMDFITTDIKERLFKEPNVKDVQFNVVWSPAWSKNSLSHKGKLQLRMWGISAV